MDRRILFWICYLGLGVLFTIAELVRPARKLRYRKALPRDLVAMMVCLVGVATVVAYVYEPVDDFIRHDLMRQPLAATIAGLSLAPRIVVYYLAVDLGSYWLHRLMHTRHLWRLHRWHHAPTQMYWLAGVRTSLPQQILFNLPGLVVLPILAGARGWVFLAMLVEGVIRNDWMHMNVTWRSNWLEWILVTPRYHHIHHSADAKLHNGNYGSLFSIWDRLFGTYLDPDTTQPKKFGTGEPKRDPVLLVLGV